MSGSVLLRSIDAWNESDWDVPESIWDLDGEIVAPEECPEAGGFTGWPAIREQFEPVRDSWAREGVEVLEVQPLLDRRAAQEAAEEASTQ